MGDYIYIGKITGTHGIKGEVKILSSFFEKDKVFINGHKLYVTPLYNEEVISTYRVHKNFDLVTFKNYSDINEVNKYRGMNVYVKRSDLSLGDGEYLLEDLINYEVYDKDILLGKVLSVTMNNSVMIKVQGSKTFYIPFIDEYIDNVDTINKKIITKNGSDLII